MGGGKAVSTFFDETAIRQFNSYRPIVRRRPSKRYSIKFVRCSIKHSPSLLMVELNSTINANTYQEILQEKLSTHIEILQCNHFLQDGAPCHQSKSTSAWLARNEVSLIGQWPGNSPHLNVIENCWHMLKSKVASYNTSSTKHLKEKIIKGME